MERLTLPSKQEIFNLVWKHFVEEKNPASYDPELEKIQEQPCRYRRSGQADDRVRCAVGLLIPDNRYDPDIEGFGIRRALENVYHLNVPQVLFLNDLQGAHDEAARLAFDDYKNFERISFHETIEAKLRDLARKYELEAPKK